MNDDRAVVTGGAGFIGSHLCKYLYQHGWKNVHVIDLNRPKHIYWNSWSSDIRDLHLFPYSVVFHLASPISEAESYLNPDKYYDNIEFTLDLLKEIGGNYSTYLIYASSAMAGVGNSPYAKMKRYTERILDYHSMAYDSPDQKTHICSLRYYNVTGADMEGELGEDHDPETHLIPSLARASIQKEPFYLYGDGEIVRDYIHVNDVVRRTYKAFLDLKKEKYHFPKIVEIGTGVGYSVSEVINKFKQECNSNLHLIRQPPRSSNDIQYLVADGTAPISSIPLSRCLIDTYNWELKKCKEADGQL